MSYWVEIHCDGMSTRRRNDLARYSDDGCYSFSNDNIGAMVDRLPGTIRTLTIRAKEQRWKRRGGKWLCPRCAAVSTSRCGGPE